MVAVVEPLIRRTNFAVIDRPTTAMKYVVDMIGLGAIAMQEEAGVRFGALIGLAALMIGAYKPMVM